MENQTENNNNNNNNSITTINIKNNNNMDTSTTILNFLNSNGIGFQKNTSKIKLSNQQRFVNRISKEIQIMTERMNNGIDFQLDVLKRKGDVIVNPKTNEKSTLKYDRLENRFHQVVDGVVLFNFKYKGKIVVLPSQKTVVTKNGDVRVTESLKCKNDIQEYVNLLDGFKNVFEGLNENDEMFNQIS